MRYVLNDDLGMNMSCYFYFSNILIVANVKRILKLNSSGVRYIEVKEKITYSINFLNSYLNDESDQP